jgi:hypothetical protein
VRIGDAVLENGACRGEVRSTNHAIAWELSFVPAERESRRVPRLLEALPLPMRAAHANAEMEVEGWVEVVGERRALRGAPGTQANIYGTRQAVYSPRQMLLAAASRAGLRRGDVVLTGTRPGWRCAFRCGSGGSEISSWIASGSSAPR